MRLLAILCFAGTLLSAQEYSFRSFGNAEGLSNLSVENIYQDHAGFLWLSTDNGIFRYDGERFQSFGRVAGRPSNFELSFGDAPDGSLLVGSTQGLSIFRGNHFEKVEGPFTKLDADMAIQSDGKGRTYLGTDAGLILLTIQEGNPHFKQQILPPPPGVSGPDAHGILLDGDLLWYGCGVDLCRIQNGQAEIFGRASGLSRSPVTTIRKSREGELWVHQINGDVLVMAPGQKRFRDPGIVRKSAAFVNPPVLDADGRLLLPTANGLLLREGKGWREVGASQGLRGGLYTVLEDRQHSLWIGATGRGLVQWRGYGEWESYSSVSGLSNDMIWDLQPRPGGVLWVGTGGGLWRGERRNSVMTWKPIPGFEKWSAHSLAFAPGGDLWVGTEAHGLAKLDVQSGAVEWLDERQGFKGRDVYSLLFDRQQRLWVATDAGVYLASPPYNQFHLVSELPPSIYWAIVEGADGTIWTGTESGLYALSGGRWLHFDHSNGLSSQEVLSLGPAPNGEIWIGYEYGGGIDRVRLDGARLRIQTGVQRPGSDGLIYFLRYDTAGRLWAGTEHGVDLWDGFRWTHYDTGDGLVWNDCDVNAFAAEADGTVWIGTAGGLSRFKPRPTGAPHALLSVVFTRLVLGQKDVTGQQNVNSGRRDNSLVANFTALNASRDNGVVFRYRLEGASSAWTETSQRQLYFAKLAPGQYSLQIEAQDGDGLWTGQRAAFSFRVPEPWYLSWWFLSLCVLLPLLAVFALVRWRVAQLEKEKREFQKLKEAHDAIRNLAFYDPVTALPNRRLLHDRLDKILAPENRVSRMRALLLIDLDNFKVLNDTMGHHAGDLVLSELAQRLSTTIREADTVARMGGDEFVVLLDLLSESAEQSAALAEGIAEKTLALIAQPFPIAGRECHTGASIGITVFGNRNETANGVLQQAEIALYQAKAAGKNAVRFFAPALQAAVNHRASLEADLRQAIREDRFILYYQPQWEGERLTGAEALVRWNHPTRGILPPGEFIPLAEETGLILLLGDSVLEKACRQIAAWAYAPETAHLIVSVNISARQFRQPDFVARVLGALESAGANPARLKLELTESILVDSFEDVIAKMTALNARGLGFSLDDFGTGYSSLAYLSCLPLAELKIDRSFVRDLQSNARIGSIVESIVSMGRALGLSIIAEGVETVQQRSALAGLGCFIYQGYYYSPPVPIASFEKLACAAGLAQQPTANLPE